MLTSAHVYRALQQIIKLGAIQGIPEVALRNLEDGSLVYLLQDNADLAAKLTSKVLPQRIDTTVEVADGFLAPVKILLPPHMLEGEQYPLLVYVYGGPGSQMVDNRYICVRT
jgi:dipeptidyl aminopeptidase/acylaminoacyl peptidase